MRIAMVAGEASGDLLGTGLIRALRQHFPDARFEGIGGSGMIAEGFESRVPMERLSVMGFVEVLGRLRELLGLRQSMIDDWIQSPPDVFIGIDAPDFNLGLERALKQAGIPSVHYVSPSVWAWRQKRVQKIHESVDLMLVLFPFEAQFYEQHGVPVRFVGHPLADQIELESTRSEARKRLGVDADAPVVALLPGSRGAETRKLAPVFLQTAQWLLEREPALQFLMPAANPTRRAELEGFIAEHAEGLPVTLFDGQSRLVMAASDVVLLASGTATLEAMLLKRPMVVAYKVNFLTWLLAKLLVKSLYISLPNNLAGKELAPEILQYDAKPPRLGAAVLERLRDKELLTQLDQDYRRIHEDLRRDASRQSADAIAELLGAVPAARGAPG